MNTDEAAGRAATSRRIQASESDCGVDPAEMPPDLANNLARMSQKANVPCALDDLEAGARDRLGKPFLPGCRHDCVLGTGKHQSGNINLPEPVGDIKSLKLGQTPSHDALVGLPDSFDHKVRQRSRLGLGSVQEIEELIHELVVRRQGEPLQHSTSDGGPDRARRTWRPPPGR